tara:strand:- start:245 stop:547 length:303 start_codon:yes stop_codon:yes gene_type:complete
MTIKRIIRKKKKNETEEALAKVSGAKELEMAATILRELAERENRKGKIEKLSKKRNESKKEAKHSDHDKKMKRLKELETLQKSGILTVDEFKKLKLNLLD